MLKLLRQYCQRTQNKQPALSSCALFKISKLTFGNAWQYFDTNNGTTLIGIKDHTIFCTKALWKFKKLGEMQLSIELQRGKQKCQNRIYKLYSSLALDQHLSQQWQTQEHTLKRRYHVSPLPGRNLWSSASLVIAFCTSNWDHYKSQGLPHQETELCDNHCLNTPCLKKTRSFESAYTTGILSHIFVDKVLGENRYDWLASKFRTAQSNLFETEILSDQPYQLSAN